MNQFDAVLRRGLMDANLAQYENVLVRADRAEPDFSPRYLRERMRLLADPWNWAKRRRERTASSRGKRLVRNIACVLLACTVAFGALMAASPAVRAAVFGWLRTFAQGEAYYEGPYGNFTVHQAQPDWRPAWVPEEYHLCGVSVSGAGRPQSPAGSRYSLEYLKDGMGPDSTGFSFTCRHSVEAHVGLGSMDGVTVESATVWDREADFYARERGHNTLIWNGPNGEFFQVAGYLDKETLEKIADSVQAADAPPMPEYRPEWLPELAPEGPLPSPAAIRDEAVMLSFQLKDLSMATLLYASPAMGPLWTPEGPMKEEAAEINGMPARYWPAVEEDDGVMGAAYATKDGVRTVVSRSLTTWNMNTVMWTDPETGISFQLQATTLLPKEDLLKMAESVTVKETP